MGVRPMRTSFQRPWQNGIVERWGGTYRRELLDHVIVLGEVHLRRLLREFVDDYQLNRGWGEEFARQIFGTAQHRRRNR